MTDTFDDIGVAKFGTLIKNRGVSVTISYGSGGFCVIVSREGQNAGYGYAWDLETAVRRAFDNLGDVNFRDEVTNPNAAMPYKVKFASIKPKKQ